MLLCLFVKVLLQVGVTLKKGGVRGMGWVVWSHSRERVGDPPCGSEPTSLHRPSGHSPRLQEQCVCPSL